jgi:hypothetical protein
MKNAKGGRFIASVIILVGAIVLISALFMPWYSYKTPVGTGSVTITFYPGMPGTNGTIQYSCSGLPSCPAQTSYSTQDLNNTGTIAEVGYYLLIVGFVLGIIGAIVGIASRSKPRRAHTAVPLAVIALILAIVAVGLFAAELPTAISNDVKSHTGSGPWSSFFGSSSGASWGPAIGWYLAIVAFVFLLVGVIVLAIARREPPPQAATAPGPSM